jgi:arylsulfatase A-like enzyme
MIVRWPGRVAPASMNKSIVTSTDMCATILEMAGVKCRSELVSELDAMIDAYRAETGALWPVPNPVV